MIDAEKSNFFQLIGDAMAFYRQDVSPFALQVWWQACQGYSLEQVRKAMTAHAMDPDRGQYPPKPADLVRALKGTSTDRAMLAWGKCLSAMEHIGAYTDMVFDDAAIHAVVEDLGGWPKVCRTEMKDLSYLQHRFCEAHRAYGALESFEYPKRLPGDRSPDVDFLRRGLPIPAPAVIGDADAAREVYRCGGQAGARASVQFDRDFLKLGA